MPFPDHPTVYAIGIDFTDVPENHVAVSSFGTGDVQDNQTVETVYDMTVGKVLTIHTFRGGCNDAQSGIRTELVHRPGGDPGQDALLTIPCYASGENFSRVLKVVLTGSAGDQIVLKRINDPGGGPVHASAEWLGFVEQ